MPVSDAGDRVTGPHPRLRGLTADPALREADAEMDRHWKNLSAFYPNRVSGRRDEQP
ncbi:hypothetical protein AB0D46_13880 [Streptomyces sp. NPDC048383]|uniref:hypothetical protein n=1 Tax=Streptomyces sp. NPDC048383 TaxID=3155386 RepID=UPI00344792A2